MRKSPSLLAVQVALHLLTWQTLCPAQTIAIGEGAGKPGETVSVPVTLEAAVDCTALMVRIEFDESMLEAPSATAGDIPAPGHSFDFFSPEAGRLNIVIFGMEGAAPFQPQSGVVARLHFQVAAETAPGEYEIKQTIIGAPALTASGLLDESGAERPHAVNAGRVTVEALNDAADWRRYQ